MSIHRLPYWYALPRSSPLALVLLLGFLGVAAHAPFVYAMRDDRLAAIPYDELAPVGLTTQIPVGWQMSRSRLTQESSSIVSETYREMWSLEVQGSGLMNLANARGRVPIYPAEPSPGPRLAPPALFLIGDHDLARLVGIPLDPEEKSADEGEYPPHDVQRPILVNLVRPSRTGIDLSITWTENIHYEVHLDFGGSPGI